MAPRPGHHRLTTTGPGWRGVLRGERGSASVELVIVTPCALMLLLVIVQCALWSHATHIAQTAASQGLAAARVQHATAEQGTARAQHLLDQLGHGPLTDTTVTTDRGALSTTVRVAGVATAVIPFLRLPVRGDATGPTERFLPDR